MIEHNEDENGRAHVSSKDCWCNPEVIEVPTSKTPDTIEVNVVMGAQLRAIVRSALLHVRQKVDKVASSVGDVIPIIDAELSRWPLGADPEDTLPQWLFWRFAYGLGKVEESKRTWEDQPEDEKAFWQHEADAVRRAVGRGGFKSAKKGSGFVLSTPINELHQKDAESGGEVQSLRPLGLKNAEMLGEAIRIAVGAASTCWTNMMGAGVFKSEEALDISVQLEHYVNDRIRLGLGQIQERHQAVADLMQKYIDSGQPMVNAVQIGNLLTGRTRPEEYASALTPQPEHTKRCWCGGEVGKRQPGDDDGMGCLRNITHRWQGVSDRG